MSVYFCHYCNQYVDADLDGIVEVPDGECCESCFEDLLDLADCLREGEI